MKHLSFLLLIALLTNSTFIQAQDLNRPFIVSYRLKDNKNNNGYFLRIYKKGDSVRTIVIDSTADDVYDAYKNLKSGKTYWINYNDSTKLLVEEIPLSVDTSEWTVKDLGIKNINNYSCKRVKKKNKSYSLDLCYVEHNQFDFSALINHLHLQPFNSIINTANAFDGFLTTCSIKGLDENLKINLEDFALTNIPDSLFSQTKFNDFQQRGIKPANIDSAMYALKGIPYKTKSLTRNFNPYEHQLDRARENVKYAKINLSMNYAQEKVNAGDLRAFTSLDKLKSNTELFSRSIDASIKYYELGKHYNELEELNMASTKFISSKDITYYSPIIILNGALSTFYNGTERERKFIYSALKINDK